MSHIYGTVALGALVAATWILSGPIGGLLVATVGFGLVAAMTAESEGAATPDVDRGALDDESAARAHGER